MGGLNCWKGQPGCMRIIMPNNFLLLSFHHRTIVDHELSAPVKSGGSKSTSLQVPGSVNCVGGPSAACGVLTLP